MRPVSFAARLAACLLLSLAACDERARELPAGYDRDAAVTTLTSSLEASGYVVDDGEFVIFRIEDCEGLPSCYGNNPSSPYGLFRFPPAPGEDLGATTPPLSDASARTSYRLRADEALVFLGRTPPRARYFSFVPYVADRDGVSVFGSVAVPANHLTLETSGPASDPFDRETAVVVTGDPTLAEDVRASLARQGLGSIVNVQSLPSDVVRFGHDAAADRLTMLFRVALFEDAAAGAAYLANPGARILRVRAATPRTVVGTPFGGYAPQGTGTTEEAYRDALDRLGAAIDAANAGATITPSAMVLLRLTGTTCIANLTECNGDNPDTLYWGMLPRLLGPKDRIVVYGIDHGAVGKATYTNVSAYDYGTLAGVAAVHDDVWAGSAEALLPGDAQASALFAWTFARDCTGVPRCTVIGETFPGVALDDTMTVVLRAYLEPGTATAPYDDEVIGPRVRIVTVP